MLNRLGGLGDQSASHGRVACSPGFGEHDDDTLSANHEYSRIRPELCSKSQSTSEPCLPKPGKHATPPQSFNRSDELITGHLFEISVPSSVRFEHQLARSASEGFNSRQRSALACASG